MDEYEVFVTEVRTKLQGYDEFIEQLGGKDEILRKIAVYDGLVTDVGSVMEHFEPFRDELQERFRLLSNIINPESK
ncbi:hypothetical protein CMUS01_15138 [Colletotrichum musicola]|uniref:Uncharacterized protein n=1 Tax=Colletotrichum musicola TaxID=2175873 RepID=A0A8H6IYV9_9PEZI|nr:hypothetical protein CMUS01_15138 [Colletotrichum musicola]